MAAVEDKNSYSSYRLSESSIAGIALVSMVYFADILLKARYKCFWFDELFTTYLCRLPDFKSTWAAVAHGADFNPPMFYLLTRAAQSIFGEGLIATRLPAMIGFWVFGVCLFLFVARRAGALAGFIAGVFPFFTLAQYYAYEARAHGVVLGWCGLALVCWQRDGERRGRSLWLAGFGLSLTAALLTHVYAVYLFVPFVLVELFHLLQARSLNWGILGVMALAFVAVTLSVYLPLFHAYRAAVPPTFFAASHDLLQRFLVNVIGPATIVLLLPLLLNTIEGVMAPAGATNTSAFVPRREVAVAAGLACIPLFGLIGCKVIHGPFVDRYFLPSLAGYAILLGFASSSRGTGSWAAKALAGCMLLLMLADIGSTLYLSKVHRIMLVEPSTGLRLSTTPSNPMQLYSSLSTNESGLDIMVFPSLEYLYLFRYAPPSVVSHLYYAAPANDVNLLGYEKLRKWARIGLKTMTVSQFLATHKQFLVYESGDSVHIEDVHAILSAGYKLLSARADAVGIMYEYSK